MIDMMTWRNFKIVPSLVLELNKIRTIMAEEKDGFTYETISYQMVIRYLVIWFWKTYNI